jgi:hypothetical protein
MTLAEAFECFDSIIPPDPEWRTLDGLQLGVPVCCKVPVILKSIDGRSTLRCCVCGFTLAEIANQWIIQSWGSRGIRLPKGVSA